MIGIGGAADADVITGAELKGEGMAPRFGEHFVNQVIPAVGTDRQVADILTAMRTKHRRIPPCLFDSKSIRLFGAFCQYNHRIDGRKRAVFHR